MISRRQILFGLGAGGILSSAGYYSLIRRPDSAPALTYSAIELTPDIQDMILDRYLARLKRHPSPSDSLLNAWIMEDFSEQRTYSVDGWLLAETEIGRSLHEALDHNR